MLGWPIQAARNSALFHTVMVSTEDDAIAEVARDQGAAVPFLRSAATADDQSGLLAVLAEVLAEWDRRGERFDAVCCILATAALITPDRLRQGLSLYQAGGGKAAFSVLEYPHPIERALRRGEDGATRLINPTRAQTRTQDLQPTYYDAGQFYWLSPDVIRSGVSPLSTGGATLVLDPMEAQDIDTEADWRIAEMKFTGRSG